MGMSGCHFEAKALANTDTDGLPRTTADVASSTEGQAQLRPSKPDSVGPSP